MATVPQSRKPTTQGELEGMEISGSPWLTQQPKCPAFLQAGGFLQVFTLRGKKQVLYQRLGNLTPWLRPQAWLRLWVLSHIMPAGPPWPCQLPCGQQCGQLERGWEGQRTLKTVPEL